MSEGTAQKKSSENPVHELVVLNEVGQRLQFINDLGQRLVFTVAGTDGEPH